MTVQLVALGIFVAVFAIAAIRNVNIGIVMFPVAAAVGIGLAHMKLADVVGEFPLDILVLLVGVTYFFGIAHSNGTVDWPSKPPSPASRAATASTPSCSSSSPASSPPWAHPSGDSSWPPWACPWPIAVASTPP